MGTKAFDNYADLITFSRASGGTALRPVSYGPELVTNTWVDNSAGSSSISELNGELTLTCVGSDVAWAYEQINLKTGALYVVSYEVKQDVGGNVHVYIGETTSGSQSYSKLASVGFHADSFIASANTSYISLREFTAGTAIVDNISVKEVLFDQPNGTLTLFNHPNNIPRIEYDADGNRLGLLIEEQRTNLFGYSDMSSGWTTTADGDDGTTFTQNASIGPDGQQKMWRFNPNFVTDPGSAARIFRKYEAINTTVGDVITFSVFIKPVVATSTYPGGATLDVRVSLGADRLSGDAYYNCNTLEWDSVPSGVTAIDQDVGNGIRRLSITYTANANDTSNNHFVIFSNRISSSFDPYPGGMEDIRFGYAQVELGAFPTSYIATSGSPATRAVDVASIPTSAFGYNQKQGTLFADVSSFGNNNFQYAAAITDSAAIGVYEISLRKAGGDWSYYVGGSANITEPFVSDAKLVGAYKQNSFNASINGSSETEDTSGTVPSNLVSLRIGRQGGFQLNGHIKSIAYYPRRLTNAQLQELTA